MPPCAHLGYPPRQVSRHFVAWLAHDQIRVGDRVFWPGLLLGVRGVHQLHRKLLRCTAPSKPTSNSLILASFCLRRSSRLVPACGVRISRFLPACVRRKLAQHQSYQSRKGGFVSGRYRYAPRPDPFGWALAQPRRSQFCLRAAGPRATLSERQQTIPGSSATFFS